MEKENAKNDRVVCLIALDDKRLLLIKKQGRWMLPGGIQIGEETDIESLERNLFEQLPCLKLNKPNLFNGFFGKPELNVYCLEAVTYWSEVSWRIASGENCSFGWFDNQQLEELKISSVAKKAIESLREQKRL